MTDEQQHEMGRCIFREAHDAIFIIHPGDLKVLDANPATQRLTGLRKKQLVGQPLLDFLECESPDRVSELMRACQSTASFLSTDGYFLKTAEGGRKPMHVSVSRIHVEPQPLGLVIARDISKLRQAEEERRQLEWQLQHAQKLESLGVLTGAVAHDFNNLMTAILGHADLALQDAPSSSPLKEHLWQVLTATQKGADLTRQMLIYAGKGRFHIQPVHLPRLIEEMGELLRVSVPKNIRVEYDFDPECPLCDGDSTQLSQVVMNLIVNAAEAIGEKRGRIRVSTRAQFCDRALWNRCHMNENLPEGIYLCLTVSDDGCGMTPETMSRMFEPFFTTKFLGRGLGLCALLGIVTGHRGAVRVESDPDRGSTFYVYLPAKTGPTPAARGEEAPARDWRGGGCVLVVDDEESVRALAKSMLARLGFEVLLASDGSEGLEVYRANAASIRAILLDYAMPQMDGREMAGELKRLGAKVPLILSTGIDDPVIAGLFEPGELAGCLRKPYRFQELSDVLRGALETPGKSVKPR